MTEFPSGWSLLTIGEVATVGRKKPTEFKHSHESVSFLPMAAVAEITGDINREHRITHAEAQKKTLTYFAEGDILFAKVTPCMENGKIARATGLEGGCGYGSTEFHVIVPGPNIEPEYLRLFLVNDDFRRDAESAMTGAVGLRRVPRKHIEDYLIPVPPLQIQKFIVRKVSNQLFRLEQTAKLLDAARAQIRLLWGATLNNLFIFEPFDTAEQRRLGDLFEFRGGYSFKSNEWKSNGVPVIKIANVQRELISWHKVDYVDDESAARTKDFEIRRGDLIQTLTGELLGASAIYDRDEPARLNQRLVRISALEDSQMTIDYLHACLQAPQLRQSLRLKSKGAAQPNVSIKDVAELLIAVPTPEEQILKLKDWEILRSRISNLEKVMDDIKVQLAVSRRSLLHAAFTGQLKNEDSND